MPNNTRSYKRAFLSPRLPILHIYLFRIFHEIKKHIAVDFNFRGGVWHHTAHRLINIYALVVVDVYTRSMIIRGASAEAISNVYRTPNDR